MGLVSAPAARAWDDPVWSHLIASPAWDAAAGLDVDGEGNAFVVGDTDGRLTRTARGGKDAWVAKYDPAGARLWLRQFGGVNYDFATAVAADRRGNAVVGGYDYDGIAWLVKFSGAGDRLWRRQLAGNRRVQDLAVGPQDSIVAGGWLWSKAASTWDAWLSKHDADGRLLWKRRWPETRLGTLNAVAVDHYGNAFVCGSVGQQPPPGWPSGRSWLAKIGTDGQLLWRREVGRFASSNACYAAATDTAGNVAIVYRDDDPAAAWSSITAVAKFSGSGELRWQQPRPSEALSGVTTDAMSRVIVVGNWFRGCNGCSFAARYTPDGVLDAERGLSFPGPSDHIVGPPRLDAAGDLLIVGSAQHPLTNISDGFIAKFPGR